jgi:hypothetical protein
MLPFLVVIALRSGRSWFPTGDLAVIALRARDVTTGRFPLTGAWSRVGFAHPGPAFYWALGSASAVTGGAPWSLIVAGALVHLVAIGAALRLAWRRGGTAVMLFVALLLTASYLAITAWGLIAPWNVYLAYPFFVVFALLAWSVALGEVRRLPWLAVVALLLVQTHIGYAFVVALPGAWAVWRLAAQVRAGRVPRGSVRRPLLWAVAWTVVLWIPVLLDQLFVTGNLGAIWSYFTSDRGPAAGLSTAAGWFASEFHVLPPWLGGPLRLSPFSGTATTTTLLWLLVPLAIVAGLIVAARRLPRFDARRELVWLVLVVVGSALVGMSQVTGDRFGYLFEWRGPVAVLLVVTALGLAWSLMRHGREVLLGGATVLLLVGVSVLVHRVATFPDALYPSAPLVARVATAAADGAPRGPLLIRGEGSEFAGLGSALIDELDRRGDPARIDPWRDFEYGRRTLRARDTSRMWLVVEEGWIGSRMDALPGARLVAGARLLPPADERELARLQRRLWRQLRRVRHYEQIGNLDSPIFDFVSAGVRGIDHTAAQRLSALNRRVQARGACRCKVFSYPTDRASMRRLHRFEFP